MSSKPFCHYFQLGKCNRGKDCDYVHEANPGFQRKPCHHFAKGHCKNGSACMYSHDKAEIFAAKEQINTEVKFREWRCNIPNKNMYGPKLFGYAMNTFWQQAWEFVSGDTSTMQETISLLAGEGGLQRVKEFLDQPFNQLSSTQLAQVFDGRLLPFLRTIAHKDANSSAMLEGRIMAIYNCVFGPGGQRAIQFFQAVVRHLSTLTIVKHGDCDTLNYQAILAIETSILALSRTIEINTTAQVNEDLPPIINAFSTLLEDLPDSAAFAFRSASRHVQTMKHRLGLGISLPTRVTRMTAVGTAATFALARELPGELSPGGPRHDNDKIDIRDMHILPTLQEIQSSRAEYLPLADPTEWHLGGIEGLLDRNFRLLREDTVGQLRDAAKDELAALQGIPSTAASEASHMAKSGARTFVYTNVLIEDQVFDTFDGLAFLLSFDQPEHLISKSKRERKDWWENSKRLGVEALICLLGADGSAFFLVVSHEPRKKMEKGTPEKIEESVKLHQDHDLWSRSDRAHVIARLVNGLETLPFLDRVHSHGNIQRRMVEFPGVLLPAFMPTLTALQRMSEAANMPFANVLAPTSTPDNPTRHVEIEPPAYATKPRFKFNLSAITVDEVPVLVTPGVEKDKRAQELEQNSSLDAGQALALVSSLSRSLSMIRGPPGTGKSYTGVAITRVLLANRSKTKIGPIVYVTFTNHALDQGLERLLDEGVPQIVRIGGRSKSERLGGVNLRILSQQTDWTKTERQDRKTLQKKLEAEKKEISRLIKLMSKDPDKARLSTYLQSTHGVHHDELFGEFGETDRDGYTLVDYYGDLVVRNWLNRALDTDTGIDTHSRAPRSIEVLQETPLNQMKHHERQNLYQFWLADMRSRVQLGLNVALDSWEEAKEKLDHIRTERDLRVLSQSQVIGITTSGLARNLDILQRVNCKVVLCEEAGEVLEAHLLTVLLPTVEHAILIGDHDQLRPRIQNFDLSVEKKEGARYALDVSLFERLVKPNDLLANPLPYESLDVQRRMHPLISRLVRQTIYPHLKDGTNVTSYPSIPGMRKRVFWLHHEHVENDGRDSFSTSYVNDFECEMTAALVSHLVKQGVYKSEDIAVITPYLGQLRKIRQRLSRMFEIVLNDRDTEDLENEGVVEDSVDAPASNQPRNMVARSSLLQALRLATVDNFQGEEAKVVIVSLVRSNTKNNPGFLRTQNRINVLLSRAQHGMYILGNSKTTRHVPMWAKVLEIFDNDGLLGDSLELCCPRHENTQLSVKEPDDFVRLAAEGGCDMPCEQRLSCGHKCTAKCHSEMLHEAVFCTEMCTRPKQGCDHNCPLPCGAICDTVCRVNVEGINVIPECGHQKTELPCYQVQDPSKIVCNVLCESKVPDCGHVVIEPCHIDVSDDTYRCKSLCGAILPCGHSCKSPCHECTRRSESGELQTKHVECTQTCDRDYTSCKHRCKARCHPGKSCPLCEEKCDVRCSHSACNKKCYEPCAPCAEETCNSHCPHSTCHMPCAAPCDWLPCSKRCPKSLACGCQCPSICGEACPPVDFCQRCGREDVKALQVDLITFDVFSDVDLDDDPCIFLACGHVFTLSSLDGVMEMRDFYEVDDAEGEIVAIKTTKQQLSSDEVRTCPECRGSLRNIARYGRIVRRALLDEATKRSTLWSNHNHDKYSQELAKEQQRLAKSLPTAHKPQQDVQLFGGAEDLLKNVKNLKTGKRYMLLMKLMTDIDRVAKRLVMDEQPFKRVHDLVETARRNLVWDHIDPFDITESDLQPHDHLQMTNLSIRCRLILLTDLAAMHAGTPVKSSKGKFELDLHHNRQLCNWVIEEADRTKNRRQAIEARIFWAMLASIERETLDQSSDVDLETGLTASQFADELRNAAMEYLRVAESACENLSGATEALYDEIQTVKKMLNDAMSVAEMKMVVAAMSTEFRSTGHWYRCENGHLFTVGECGMPMELAKCPACGQGVGGQHHRAVEGVTLARDIDEMFGGMVLDQQ